MGRVADKGRVCLIRVSDASCHQEEMSVTGEIIIIGNKENRRVSLIYWKSGVIRRVCTLPKASEMRGVMKVVDNAVKAAQQLGKLLNTKVMLKVFTDSTPLLETIGSSSQVAEKALRQSMAYLK